MKNLLFLIQVYAFLLCVLIFTSCTNSATVGDAHMTCYPEDSEIHITVKGFGHYDIDEVQVKIFNQLKRNTFSNEGNVRLFICFEKKDKYGNLSLGNLEYVKSLNAAEAKKYVSSEEWGRHNSIFPQNWK